MRVFKGHLKGVPRECSNMLYGYIMVFSRELNDNMTIIIYIYDYFKKDVFFRFSYMSRNFFIFRNASDFGKGSKKIIGKFH